METLSTLQSSTLAWTLGLTTLVWVIYVLLRLWRPSGILRHRGWLLTGIALGTMGLQGLLARWPYSGTAFLLFYFQDGLVSLGVAGVTFLSLLGLEVLLRFKLARSLPLTLILVAIVLGSLLDPLLSGQLKERQTGLNVPATLRNEALQTRTGPMGAALSKSQWSPLPRPSSMDDWTFQTVPKAALSLVAESNAAWQAQLTTPQTAFSLQVNLTWICRAWQVRGLRWLEPNSTGQELSIVKSTKEKLRQVQTLLESRASTLPWRDAGRRPTQVSIQSRGYRVDLDRGESWQLSRNTNGWLFEPLDPSTGRNCAPTAN